MTGVMTLYRTSIGKKVVMAATGLIMLGFVLVHMYGNWKVFAGPESLNTYAEHLRLLGEPILGYGHGLWIARVVLLAAVLLHIGSAIELSMMSQGSRPVNYDQNKGVQPAHRYASYTMRWGGIVIFLFIVFHLLHFTFGVVGYGAGEFLHPHGTEYFVYNNVVIGFQNVFVSSFYIFAMLALGTHVYHGTWSMFQTLGINNETTTGLWRGLAGVLAGLLVVGNIAMPLAVLAGIIQPVSA